MWAVGALKLTRTSTPWLTVPRHFGVDDRWELNHQAAKQPSRQCRWGARNVQVKEGELSGLPGVFLVYDFSPFLMKQTEQARTPTRPWHENQCCHARFELFAGNTSLLRCLVGICFVKFVSNSCFYLFFLLQVKPWSYVFTSICAIIGGAFSVATLVWILSTFPRPCGSLPEFLSKLRQPRWRWHSAACLAVSDGPAGDQKTSESAGVGGKFGENPWVSKEMVQFPCISVSYVIGPIGQFPTIYLGSDAWMNWNYKFFKNLSWNPPKRTIEIHRKNILITVPYSRICIWWIPMTSQGQRRTWAGCHRVLWPCNWKTSGHAAGEVEWWDCRCFWCFFDLQKKENIQSSKRLQRHSRICLLPSCRSWKSIQTSSIEMSMKVGGMHCICLASQSHI